MHTVCIKFLNEADRAKGFFELAKRLRIASLPGQVYQVPLEGLKLLDELHIDYRLGAEGNPEDALRATRHLDHGPSD